MTLGRVRFRAASDDDDFVLRYNMKDRWKKFLWSSKFWALLGILGCASGFYFQRVAANGTGLWCLGLIFLGAAYLEQHEYWPG